MIQIEWFRKQMDHVFGVGLDCVGYTDPYIVQFGLSLLNRQILGIYAVTT